MSLHSMEADTPQTVAIALMRKVCVEVAFFFVMSHDRTIATSAFNL